MAFVHIVTCVQSASLFFYFKITFEFLLVITISQDHEFYFRGQGTDLLFLKPKYLAVNLSANLLKQYF